MSRMLKAAMIASAVAGGGLIAAAPAEAQYYGTGYSYSAPSYYYHAPVYGYGSSYGPGYASPTYGYGGYGYGAPAYGYGAYSPGYSSYYGPAYGVPGYGGYAPRHGKVEYDIYTPYGKREVEYKYHRNGTVSVDIDD